MPRIYFDGKPADPVDVAAALLSAGLQTRDAMAFLATAEFAGNYVEAQHPRGPGGHWVPSDQRSVVQKVSQYMYPSPPPKTTSPVEYHRAGAWLVGADGNGTITDVRSVRKMERAGDEYDAHKHLVGTPVAALHAQAARAGIPSYRVGPANVPAMKAHELHERVIHRLKDAARRMTAAHDDPRTREAIHKAKDLLAGVLPGVAGGQMPKTDYDRQRTGDAERDIAGLVERLHPELTHGPGTPSDYVSLHDILAHPDARDERVSRAVKLLSDLNTGLKAKRDDVVRAAATIAALPTGRDSLPRLLYRHLGMSAGATAGRLRAHVTGKARFSVKA
jgi:hypothetical protein